MRPSAEQLSSKTIATSWTLPLRPISEQAAGRQCAWAQPLRHHGALRWGHQWVGHPLPKRRPAGATWENLFSGLNELMALLHTTPGTSAPTLAEETTVVVMSEMGRTPALNANLGKDHWPFTSVMVIGDGFTGDRVVGGFDAGWMGQSLDLAQQR